MLKIPEIPYERCFFCKDGRVLKNLEDLKNELKRFISKEKKIEVFNFHLRYEDNDYAKWMRHVFNFSDLSAKIRKTKTPEEMLKEIENFEKENEDKVVNEIKTAPIEKVEEDLKIKIHERSEKSEELYDKMKQLKKKSRFNKKDFEDSISTLKEEYDELSKDITEHRKEGKDMFIPALKLKIIKPKIDYYEASQNKEDFEKIESLFRDVRLEFNDALAYEEPDLKSEIMNEIKLAKVGEQ